MQKKTEKNLKIDKTKIRLSLFLFYTALTSIDSR